MDNHEQHQFLMGMPMIFLHDDTMLMKGCVCMHRLAHASYTMSNALHTCSAWHMQSLAGILDTQDFASAAKWSTHDLVHLQVRCHALTWGSGNVRHATYCLTPGASFLELQASVLRSVHLVAKGRNMLLCCDVCLFLQQPGGLVRRLLSLCEKAGKDQACVCCTVRSHLGFCFLCHHSSLLPR